MRLDVVNKALRTRWRQAPGSHTALWTTGAVAADEARGKSLLNTVNK